MSPHVGRRGSQTAQFQADALSDLNLLMGEFSRANGPGKTFAFAIEDIFTGSSLAIALIPGLIGYVVGEYLR
jgi:hypothetical protein